MKEWDLFNKIYEASPIDKSKPHGWIQWKGTDVCIDLHCKCGHHGHHDGDFFYHYECPECGRKWSLDPNISLLPVNNEQAKFIKENHIEFQGDA